jgi:hypothetical protein
MSHGNRTHRQREQQQQQQPGVTSGGDNDDVRMYTGTGIVALDASIRSTAADQCASHPRRSQTSHDDDTAAHAMDIIWRAVGGRWRIIDAVATHAVLYKHNAGLRPIFSPHAIVASRRPRIVRPPSVAGHRVRTVRERCRRHRRRRRSC